MKTACKNGHPYPESRSKTRSRCAVCHREKQREWARANREKKREADRAYYEQNQDKIKQRVRSWIQENPERNRANKRKSAQKSRRENPEKHRLWNVENARKRLLGRNTEAYMWSRVLRHDPCSYCGGSGGVIDHIHPLAKSGGNEWDNLCGACARCNGAKQDRDLLFFLAARRRP